MSSGPNEMADDDGSEDGCFWLVLCSAASGGSALSGFPINSRAVQKSRPCAEQSRTK